MGKNITELKSFVTTENTKAFVIQIDNTSHIYYGNVEHCNDAENLNYNHGCLFDNNNQIYQNLYNPLEFYYKSANYGQNTFNHKLLSTEKLSNVILVKNFIYTLNTNGSPKGINILSDDVYQTLAINNGKILIDDTLISTYTFNRDNVISSNNYYKNTNTRKLYQQIFETPGINSIDYDSGYYPANVFKCKNLFDEQYNEQSNNKRLYISIDKCNNQVYLKYIIDGTEYVETIEALNRHEALNIHKTNMYDIDIVCEKIFNNTTNSSDENFNKKLEVLKFEIANCIKDICKQITPIDTQLINVNVYNSNIELN